MGNEKYAKIARVYVKNMGKYLGYEEGFEKSNTIGLTYMTLAFWRLSKFEDDYKKVKYYKENPDKIDANNSPNDTQIKNYELYRRIMLMLEEGNFYGLDQELKLRYDIDAALDCLEITILDILEYFLPKKAIRDNALFNINYCEDSKEKIKKISESLLIDKPVRIHVTIISTLYLYGKIEECLSDYDIGPGLGLEWKELEDCFKIIQTILNTIFNVEVCQEEILAEYKKIIPFAKGERGKLTVAYLSEKCIK